MYISNHALRRPPPLWAAVLLACGVAASAHADEGGDAIVGVSSSVNLPTQAKAATTVVAGTGIYRGCGLGGQSLRGGSRRADPRAGRQRDRRGSGHRLRAQRGGAAVGRYRRWRLHDDPPGGTRQTFFIDTREKAPAGATPDMFVGVPNATLQGVAVGVPGMVRGTALALERYGNLKLADVIQPAIKLADEGFAATPRYTAVSCNNGGRSTNSPEAAAYFCPGGQPVPVGSLVLNKPLAQTFRAHRRQRPGLLLQVPAGEGLRHCQGHRRGSEVQPPPGARAARAAA